MRSTQLGGGRRQRIGIALALSAALACAAYGQTVEKQHSGAITIETIEAVETAETIEAATEPVEALSHDGVIPRNLVSDLASPIVETRQKARQEFEDLCFNASRPGAESERAGLCIEILELVEAETPELARVWMLRQLANIGGDECAPKLTELLSDDALRIRELSRRALQRNPSPRAAEALRVALDYANEPAWKIALINALAARRDTESSLRFAKLARSDDEAVAAAAIAALGDIGDAAAADALLKLHAGAKNEQRAAISASLLRAAERLSEGGETAQAKSLYDDTFASPDSPALRVAALCGLVSTQGEAVLPRLLDLMRGDDAEMGVIAARLALDLPGNQVTHALASTCSEMNSGVRAALLDGFGERGDKAALHAVQEGVEDEDEHARMAAIRSLGLLGDGATAVSLARVAANSTGETRQAARESFTRLRGDDVDSAILAEIGAQDDADVRVELIKALAARQSSAAVVQLFDFAKDADESVRVAAYEALGELCASDDMPLLLSLMSESEGEGTREAAEAATVKIAQKNEDEDARVGPILAALTDADGPAKASLVRVLGRLGGAQALKAIRAARSSDDQIVADASIRALADWPTDEVMDDLLAIARQNESETHSILALRGYVRLVRLPSERSDLETFNLLSGAMGLATRDGEKKVVLGALADVGRAEALALAESLLSEDALRDETAVTMVKIARLLAAEQPDAALAAIGRARAATTAERVQQQADEASEFLERFRGYCAAWLVSGPYSEEGKDAAAIYDIAFAPENAASDVDWRPLAINGGENPWIFDLAKTVSGDDRCVYVRTEVWSDGASPARLEIGSDDCVKAWLNGDLVHANKAFRGITPGEDKVDVTLNEGWNTLMLKIVQANGGWGFCAALRAPDGEAIDGMRYRAK